MSGTEPRVTRGHGLLEGFLAQQRARRANSLIPEAARIGRILDIGCGSYPEFLMSTNFGERYGLDRVAPANVQPLPGLSLVEHDVAHDSGLPFEDGFFDVVTMLAVFEHLETPTLNRLLLEVRRVLRLGGVYVMTTPTRWTEGLLKAMASLKLVSHEEVGEHKAQYSRREVVSLLLKAGFDRSQISHGTFELGMNVWAVAAKAL